MRLKMEYVKNFAGTVVELVAYGLLAAASYKVGYLPAKRDKLFVGYDDAVEAIMKSSMYSHDKREAVESLKRFSDSEFYRAIVHIAKDSSMYSHDKVDMIRQLSEK